MHRKSEGKGEVEEEGGEEEENGIRRLVKRADPREPTRQEREEHEMTHLPFRNWCSHCVRGRGTEEACRRIDREQGMAEVHMDFVFMGEDGSLATLAVLVAKERSTGMTMATVAPRKSEGFGWRLGCWRLCGSVGVRWNL